MFSKKTLVEIMRLSEELTKTELGRLFTVFDFKGVNPNDEFVSKAVITKSLFVEIQKNPEGPFGDDLQKEVLEYIIEELFRKNSHWAGQSVYDGEGGTITELNVICKSYPMLCNSLARDGFKVEGRKLIKLLPQEIEESKIESELMQLLESNGFHEALSHLKQGVDNHGQGNWESANGMFRSFIESLVISIHNELNSEVLSNRDFKKALKWLTYTANPPFFSIDLNEMVEKDSRNTSFIHGLWSRLCGQGSHAGTSDEEDSTFRYHSVIVFSHYLLARYRNRTSV